MGWSSTVRVLQHTHRRLRSWGLGLLKIWKGKALKSRGLETSLCPLGHSPFFTEKSLLLRRERVLRKGLQVISGRDVHTLQFTRPQFGVCDCAWKDISDGEGLVKLEGKPVEEILLAGCNQPE